MSIVLSARTKAEAARGHAPAAQYGGAVHYMPYYYPTSLTSTTDNVSIDATSHVTLARSHEGAPYEHNHKLTPPNHTITEPPRTTLLPT